MAVMTTAEVNGLTIDYEIDGTGEPLLCVAGLGMQLSGWPSVWVDAWTRRGYQVIRVDNRDIGRSSKTDGPVPTFRQLAGGIVAGRFAHSPYTVEDMADDLAGLLDRIGLDSANVVGVSMGGMISQALAIRHPQRVRSLTSIMSNTGDRRTGRPSTRLLAKLGRLMPRDGTVTVDSTVEVFRLISGPHFDEAEARQLILAGLERSTDSVGTRRQLLAIEASPNRTPGLRRLTVPALVIHGMLDRLVAPSGGVATARAIPGSRLLMFPDMAHDLPRQRLDEVVDAIDANVARARATTSA